MNASSITTLGTKVDINATSEDGVIQLSLIHDPTYSYKGLYTIEYTGTASLQGISYRYYLVLFRTEAIILSYLPL